MIENKIYIRSNKKSTDLHDINIHLSRKLLTQEKQLIAKEGVIQQYAEAEQQAAAPDAFATDKGSSFDQQVLDLLQSFNCRLTPALQTWGYHHKVTRSQNPHFQKTPQNE